MADGRQIAQRFGFTDEDMEDMGLTYEELETLTDEDVEALVLIGDVFEAGIMLFLALTELAVLSELLD